jgi:hypothetical protein
MDRKRVTSGRVAAGFGALIAALLAVQVAVALAAGPETYASQEVVAQAATATPFRFLTPTPFAPAGNATAPRAGGFPTEIAFLALAGGLAAIGGGSLVLRRKPTR